MSLNNVNMGINSAVSALTSAVRNAAAETALKLGGELPENMIFALEHPKREGQGDRASNAAMQLARPLGRSPREIASAMTEKLMENSGGLIDKIEIAGPGFINLFLSKKWFAEAASCVLKQGDDYGAVELGHGRRVQVEFVSSNPTGPLHIGHGRGAAVGDAVARILSFTGWDVQREYYVNDAGLQIETLGKSAQARYFEICGRPELMPFPENGYKGDYLIELAREIKRNEGKRFLDVSPEESLPWFKKHASGVILDEMKACLERFGVRFDLFFSEASLYERGLVSVAMDRLKERGCTFESDGALWFRTTDFGDDKDRVLIRANGVPTYFASDVAYHHDKFIGRGFERVIDVWGADHHGYIPRMKAAVEAMGAKPENFEVLLIQLVNLMRDGQPVAMSTRAGEFVELGAVLDEVGVDATRFFFLTRRSDSPLDFDLELAKKQSSDNPVYYVQYAHARIASVIREWKARGGDEAALSSGGIPETVFENRDARALAEALADFPGETEAASRDLSPQTLTAYSLSLAGIFHSFYNTNRILGEEPDTELGRLKLANAARIVLTSCLGLLGVSAPEHM